MLSASQRVRLMTEINARLGGEGSVLVDVTLRQFKLPTEDTWHGATGGYLLGMLEGAPDDALVALGEHVGFVLDRPASEAVAPPFWRPGMLRVFITHIAARREFAAELQGTLLEWGVSAFVAHNDIEPTLEWLTVIQTALSTAHAVVALLHPGFHESKWTDQELGFGMGRGIPVFAIGLGEAPYGLIGRFQAFSGQGRTAQALSGELVAACCRSKQTRRLMARSLVTAFETSKTFEQAKQRIELLEGLEVWETDFAKRIARAAEHNGQISGSWGVSARVAALAKRWMKGQA